MDGRRRRDAPPPPQTVKAARGNGYAGLGVTGPRRVEGFDKKRPSSESERRSLGAANGRVEVAGDRAHGSRKRSATFGALVERRHLGPDEPTSLTRRGYRGPRRGRQTERRADRVTGGVRESARRFAARPNKPAAENDRAEGMKSDRESDSIVEPTKQPTKARRSRSGRSKARKRKAPSARRSTPALRRSETTRRGA